MPKRSAKKAKHQSFKMTPHNHSKERVFMYMVVAGVVGVVIGLLIKDDIARMMLGSAASSMGY